jgi:hypothetical protein
MPSLFWSGKLTLAMKLLVEANNVLALIKGSSGDTQGMKDRVRRGYEGQYSQHVEQYDELGYHLQDRSARYQLEGIHLQGMNVLDVGCGTGHNTSHSKKALRGNLWRYTTHARKAKENTAEGVNYTFCQLMV